MMFVMRQYGEICENICWYLTLVFLYWVSEIIRLDHDIVVIPIMDLSCVEVTTLLSNFAWKQHCK